MFSGVDSFTYVVEDATGSTDSATIYVTVTDNMGGGGDECIPFVDPGCF